MSGEWENPMKRFLRENNIDETQAMNKLQEHGVISDNCIKTEDIGNKAKAMMWLNKNFNSK